MKLHVSHHKPYKQGNKPCSAVVESAFHSATNDNNNNTINIQYNNLQLLYKAPKITDDTIKCPQ